jgi:uncharacterized membrane protein YhhN
MMPLGLLGISLLCAFVDWIAIARGWKKIAYFAKPAVMIAILAWLWQIDGFSGEMIWFSIGIIFSLAGDIFLMLPKEQFYAGLISFLIAHICYLIGFNTLHPPFYPADLVLVLLVAVTGLQLYLRLAARVKTYGEFKLTIAVLIYSVTICLMLLSALFTLVRQDWQAVPSLLVSVGALCFFFSDILLAWNRFISSQKYRRLISIIAYHIGQIMLVLGAALHYLN